MSRLSRPIRKERVTMLYLCDEDYERVSGLHAVCTDGCNLSLNHVGACDLIGGPDRCGHCGARDRLHPWEDDEAQETTDTADLTTDLITIEWSVTEVTEHSQTFSGDELHALGVEQEAIPAIMDAARRGDFEPLRDCMRDCDRGEDVLADYETEDTAVSGYVSNREISVITNVR